MTLEEQIAQLLSSGYTTKTTPGTPDWQGYRELYPEAAKRAAQLTPQEMKAGGWNTEDDWLRFQWYNSGKDAGWTLPTTGGSTEYIYSPEYKLGQALQQALGQAKSTVYSRGLDYNQFAPTIEQQLQDILSYIPKGTENPSQFFDPNLASGILSGEENRMRNQYRQQAMGIPTSIGDDIFGNTINELLGEQEADAMQLLDRGKKRGQFNDIGYNAGVGAIADARKKALSQLDMYKGDILSGYNTKLNDIRGQALQAASGFNLGDMFDLSPYSSQANSLISSASSTAPGQLMTMLGDMDFFDPSKIRMEAGQAQGAINLRDLDVLEALSTRKKADETGRGLGTQGTF
jgi:hypothetical protein